MKKIALFCVLIIVMLSLISNPGFTNSFYNSKGFGERIYFTHAQSIGMGGALIASPDIYQINTLNPAGLVFIPITRLNGDLVHQSLWSQSENESGFAKNTNLNGINLAIPLKKDALVTAFGIVPATQFDYYFETQAQVNDYNYSKIIQAKGGLNRAFFGVGFSAAKWISLGGYFNYYFGKLEQTWKVDYVSDLFWDTQDRLTRKMWGYCFSVGVIVNPLTNLHIGGIYRSGYQLTAEDHLRNMTKKGNLSYTVSQQAYGENKLTMPPLWGLGFSYAWKEKYRIAGDYLAEPWSKFKVDKIAINKYNDRDRFGFGFEILPTKNILATYFQKMTYRIGYYHQKLDMVDAGGNEVYEYGIALGLGFPFYMDMGRIDTAIRFGKRGNLIQNLVEENIVQFFISVTGGEKWFVRRGEN